MSSPTSRPEYDLYASPTNAKMGEMSNGIGTNNGPNGQPTTSQTRGLVNNYEMYSPRSKPGGRPRHNRRIFVAALAVLVVVLAIVAHSRHGDDNKKQPDGIAVGNQGKGRPSSLAPITSSSTDDVNDDDDDVDNTSPSSQSESNVLSPYLRYSLTEKTNADTFQEPRVAWLMSFPNSGTSYTLRLAQWASNVTAATNYGDECDLDPKGRNVPLYPNMANGPALKYPYKYSLPTGYALTKTHCGGRCTHCSPDKYVETQLTFHEQCLQGNRMEPLKKDSNPSPQNIRNKGKSERVMEVRYPESLVARAVHVIRDPFNNVVARFHLDWGKYNHKADKDKDAKAFVEKYTYDPNGFLKWCKSIDDVYIKDEEKSRFISEEVLELFKQIPCHGDFFRYIQWHNLAVATTAKLDLPTYVLHYENYATEFEQTKDELMNFLELDIVGEVPEFIPGKSYRNYFTKEQRVASLKLMKKLANPETWRLLDRYDYIEQK
mmetsp:Transcript_31053/g.68167  ORF Transcript_31053/g.68167 Transcript_31053/m.68167 type:complete len:489 (+) Transcript_31053:176-1642(+)